MENEKYTLPRGMTRADALKEYQVVCAAGRDPSGQPDDFDRWLEATYPPGRVEASEEDESVEAAVQGIEPRRDLVSGRNHALWPAYQQDVEAGRTKSDFWDWLRDDDDASAKTSAASLSDDPHGWGEVAARVNAEAAGHADNAKATPTQRGAASWADIASELNAEAAQDRAGASKQSRTIPTADE